MRRKDRERDAAFAWEVFDRTPFGILSLRDGEGAYGVPISPARVGETVYFHCAREGKKQTCIARQPQASLTVVGPVAPDYFGCRYRSAILRGRVSQIGRAHV